jgi:WD40 repeat protein/Flp pilus assembly protein TadD
MHYAHQRGIIHRDLTPANVLLACGGCETGAPLPSETSPLASFTPKISDFGLAKVLAGGPGEQTRSGMIVGTPSYMAPEQALGKPKDIGPATDVYALGAILYDVLTGRPPFRAATPLETLLQVQAEDPVSPGRLLPKLPRDLTTICLKCLEKEPRKRYASAQDLADDLHRFLAGETIRARPASRVERLWRWSRRNPLVAALTASVVVLLLVISLVSSLSALSLGRERMETQKQLVNAYLSQARAWRRSGAPGQRLDSLKILGVAANLVRSLKLDDEYLPQLRNEAIACLALLDLSPDREWDGWSPSENIGIDFDGTLEHYARTDRQATVSIRRVEDDTEIRRLAGGVGYDWVWWSRDGKFLAVESEHDRGLKVWKLTDEKPIVETEAAILSKSGAADFSPDSRELVVGDTVGKLSLYDLASGKLLRQWQPGLTSIQHVAFHPRKRQVAVACTPDVRICDLESGKVAVTLPLAKGAYWLAWHPEGKTLAAVGRDNNIYLWDEASRKQTQVLGGHKSGGVVVAFDHTGDLLVSNAWEGVLRLWDPRTGQQLFSTPAGMSIPRFSSDGRLAAEIDGTRLRLWKVTRGHGYRTLVRAPAQGKETYYETAISPDGRLLAAAMSDGVGFWDPHSGTPLDFLPLGWTNSVLFEPSGALRTSGAAGLLRWPVQADPASAGSLRIGPPQRLAVDGPYLQAAQSKDGKVVAIARGQGGQVLHLKGTSRQVPLREHDDVRSIAVSPDGRLVATGSHGALHVKVWETETGKFVKELAVGPFARVSFSPDGRWLATGGGGCRLWAVDSWQEGPPMGGGIQCGFAFSADSRILAVETGHGVIRLVDPDTGHEYARLENPNQERAGSLTFSPDGTQLMVTSGEAQPFHIWDLRVIGEGLAALGLPWNLPRSLQPKDLTQPLHVQVVLSDANRELRRELAKHDQSISENPLSSDLYRQRGELRYRLREFQMAVDDFSEAIRTLPKSAPSADAARLFSHRGQTYQRLGRFQKAIEDFNEAIRRQPKPAYFYARALSYRPLGDYDKVIADLQTALHMDAEHAAASNDLAWTYVAGPAKVRDAVKALPLAQKAVRIAPRDAGYRNTLGVVYYRLGQFDAALETLQRSLLDDADGSEKGNNLFFLAMSYARTGANAKARECYDDAIRWWKSQPEMSARVTAELTAFRSEAEIILGNHSKP